MSELVPELELAELQRRVSQLSGTPPDETLVEKVKDLQIKIREMGLEAIVRHEIRLVGGAPLTCSAGAQRHQWNVGEVGWTIQIGDSNTFMVKSLEDVVSFMERWLHY